MNNEQIHILVVDDESPIVQQVTFFLSELGYRITGETDSVKALELIAGFDYDIVLTDLMMPKVSGMDVIKAVNQKGSDTQIIIFTGFATTDSAIDAIKYGVYWYIKKPYNLKELAEIIQRAAEKLLLRRENVALNQKIRKMFAYITTLYDITTILYQVEDFDAVMDMILDTLHEGLKISKAAIFVMDEEDTQYAIFKARGLSSGMIAECRFRIGENIDGQVIRADQAVSCTESDLSLTRLGRYELSADDPIERWMLIPIRYADKTHGFLGVFDFSEETFSREESARLLKIMATQVAPILEMSRCRSPKQISDNQIFENAANRLVSEKILAAQKNRSIVSFAFLRLQRNPEVTRVLNLKELRTIYQNTVTSELGPAADLVWQNFDSILITQPGENSIMLEFSCTQIKRTIEQRFQDARGNQAIRLQFAVSCYPIDGESATEIIAQLASKIFHENG